MKLVFITSVVLGVLLISVLVYAQLNDEPTSIAAVESDVSEKMGENVQLLEDPASGVVPDEDISQEAVPDVITVDEEKYTQQQLAFLQYVYSRLSDEQKEEFRELQKLSFEDLLQRRIKLVLDNQ